MHAVVISKVQQQPKAIVTWDYPLVLAIIDLSYLFKGQNNDFKLQSSKEGKMKSTRRILWFQIYHTETPVEPRVCCFYSFMEVCFSIHPSIHQLDPFLFLFLSTVTGGLSRSQAVYQKADTPRQTSIRQLTPPFRKSFLKNKSPHYLNCHVILFPLSCSF